MKEEHRLALSYCLGKWLGTYKRKFIHAYVDEFFHWGTTTTSRLEGAHHVLTLVYIIHFFVNAVESYGSTVDRTLYIIYGIVDAW
jgi:hypothetical protein